MFSMPFIDFALSNVQANDNSFPSSTNDTSLPPNVEPGNSIAPVSTGLIAAEGGFSGSENLARVTRAEWQDYLARFVPKENELFDIYRDDDGRAQAVEQAGVTAGAAFDRSKATADRKLSGLNVVLTPEQQERRDRKYELNKTAAVVGAKNTMRDEKEGQKAEIMASGLSSVKKDLQR